MHVAAWAKRFLFRPEQLELPVGRLSGGEQARILIARLMREPADLLILDEPTNDLDIPTLEVLEESLAEFEGGLVLVTHDRFMLERVSTVILALDGEGGAETFADYAQWEAARAGPERRRRACDPAGCRGAPARARAGGSGSDIWSSASWTGWRRAILEAETARRGVPARGARTPASRPIRRRCRPATRRSRPRAREVDRLYARWAELEAKQPDG